MNLYKFKIIADEASFTKAAKKLNISQSALSQYVLDLERNFKLKFLVRERKGVVLTKPGEILYEYAKKQKVFTENLDTELNVFAEANLSNISFGAIDIIADHYLLDVLQNDDFKNRNFDIRINNTSILLDALLKGEIRLAFMHMPSKKDPRLNYTSLLEDEIIIVGKKKSKKLATYNKQSNTFRSIRKNLKRADINMDYSVFSSSPEFLLKVAKSKDVVATLPRVIAEKELNKKSLTHFHRSVLIKRPIIAAWPKGLILNRFEKELINSLKEVGKKKT